MVRVGGHTSTPWTPRQPSLDTCFLPPQCPRSPQPPPPQAGPSPHPRGSSHTLVASPHSFAAGDVVLIQPENAASRVQQFCQLLGLDPDQHFMLQPQEPGESPSPGWGPPRAALSPAAPVPGPHSLPSPAAGVPCPERLPQPCSVRRLVSQYLDISSVPRRSFFELLACLSPHELEREKLLELSSARGQEELCEYCTRPRRTILEVGRGAGGLGMWPRGPASRTC